MPECEQCAWTTAKKARCLLNTKNIRQKKSVKKPGFTNFYYACANHDSNHGPWHENLAFKTKLSDSSRATPTPSASYQRAYALDELHEVQSKINHVSLVQPASAQKPVILPTLDDLDEEDLLQILADKKEARALKDEAKKPVILPTLDDLDEQDLLQILADKKARALKDEAKKELLRQIAAIDA